MFSLRQGLIRNLRPTTSYAARRCPCNDLALLRFPKKSFSSSSKARDSTPPQALLSDQPVQADKENEQLTRLERLLKVSERLAKGAGKSTVPLSMKGLGVYSKDGVHTLRSPETKENLQPLPTERRMSDSFCQMELKFSQDEALREEFVGSYSKVRMGALLEKFDWLAGSSAVRYFLRSHRRRLPEIELKKAFSFLSPPFSYLNRCSINMSFLMASLSRKPPTTASILSPRPSSEWTFFDQSITRTVQFQIFDSLLTAPSLQSPVWRSSFDCQRSLKPLKNQQLFSSVDLPWFAEAAKEESTPYQSLSSKDPRRRRCSLWERN